MADRYAWVLSIVLIFLSTGSAAAADHVKAVFKDGKGKQIGTATLIATPTGLLIEAELTGLPPGAHAFHIHQTGRCDAADGFKSAGSHYSSEKRELVTRSREARIQATCRTSSFMQTVRFIFTYSAPMYLSPTATVRYSIAMARL